MTKIKALFLAVTIQFSIIGCCPKRTDILSDDMKEWVPYSINQKYSFVSADSILDTLSVKSYQIKTDIRTGECSNWRQEEIEVIILNRNNIQFEIDLNATNVNFTLTDSSGKLLTYQTYLFEDKKFYSNGVTSVYLAQIELNGQNYYEVLNIIDEVQGVDLLYAKGKGIIRYKVMNNVFETS